ncbi:MAG: MBL fold metallo-hydrolase, partial [Bacteroidales bacterium]|nr:MBL fold metallo-hydrolase [Bacteroidales bacterium]
HFSGGDTYEIEFTPLAEELCADGTPAYTKCGAEILAEGVEVKDHLHITGPEKILDAGSVEVFAFPLQHRVPCFGYLFREREKELNVYKEAIAKYGLSVEEIKALKAGHDVVRQDAADSGVSGDGSSVSGGTVISVAEATYMPPRPRSFAYCSDTREFPELAGWVRGVDLMYHEATFSKEMTEQAAVVFHSTTAQAARCAKDACAGKLVVGHYSSRFSDVGFFLDELRAVFPNSFLASDGDVFEI